MRNGPVNADQATLQPTMAWHVMTKHAHLLLFCYCKAYLQNGLCQLITCRQNQTMLRC